MADQKKRMMDGELYARKGLLYGFELGSTEILAGAGAPKSRAFVWTTVPAVSPVPFNAVP